MSSGNRSRSVQAEERILKAVTVKCRKCQGKMIQVHDLRDNARIGYSCEDCPHYYLFQ